MYKEQNLDYKSIFDLWRKRAFETNEELQEKIISYFTNWAPIRRIFAWWEPYYVKTLTITWLTLYLWFASRQSFYDYENRGEEEDATKEDKDFSYTLKRARTFIEQEYESQLQSWNTAWAIFALKNFGWKDVQTLEWEVNNNWKKKMIIEYVKSKYSDLDENWDPKKQKEEKSTS